MSDDLVKRLRIGIHKSVDEQALREEAADRIEQLEDALCEIACDCEDQCYYDHVIAYCPHQQARAALAGEKKDG